MDYDGRFIMQKTGDRSLLRSSPARLLPKVLIVKVASDDSLEYEGRIYKLSPFVGTFMPEEQRNASRAYQVAKYFSYNGKVLDEMRKEKEFRQHTKTI